VISCTRTYGKQKLFGNAQLQAQQTDERSSISLVRVRELARISGRIAAVRHGQRDQLIGPAITGCRQLTQPPGFLRAQKRAPPSTKRGPTTSCKSAPARRTQSNVTAVDRLVWPHRVPASLTQLTQCFGTARSNHFHPASLTVLKPFVPFDTTLRFVDLLLQLSNAGVFERIETLVARLFALSKLTLIASEVTHDREPPSAQIICT
jgi:hypothetical protein